MTGPAHASPPAVRGWPAEIFLARLNAAADTDVTVMLRCETAPRAAAVMAALAAEGRRQPVAKIGVRARQLEPVRRAPLAFGPVRLGPSADRAGPVDVVRAADDPSVVIARWSHLAGDARSCQEFLLDGLERAGLLGDGPACRCVRLPAGASRPLVPADAWTILREKRSAGPLDALYAAGPAIGPMIRPAPARLAAAAGPWPAGRDAFASVTMPSAPPGGGSRFAAVTAAVGALFGQPGRRRPARFGITVDIRRHEESMTGPDTAGNLSLVGWIDCPSGPDVPAAAVHARVQSLLKSRFWRQQLAFDAWLGNRSPAAVARACDTLIGRLADRAPVTVTELWRDDGTPCASCGHRRRRLPTDISPVVIPPAMPPAGLTVGITRTERETIAVLRRMTRPGTSALAWLHAVTPRLRGGEVTMSGTVDLA